MRFILSFYSLLCVFRPLHVRQFSNTLNTKLIILLHEDDRCNPPAREKARNQRSVRKSQAKCPSIILEIYLEIKFLLVLLSMKLFILSAKG